MKKNKDIFMQDKIFLWVGALTALVLSVPLIAMQFSNDVDWKLSDFTIIGVLLFGMGSLFILVARHIKPSNRLAVGILFLLAIMYMWAELAVGIFTNLGS